MSIRAIAWVLEESGAKQPELGVLTALAYHADEHGANARPSVPTLAREAGATERTAYRCLARLREAGLIELSGRHVSGTGVYRLLMRRTPDSESPPDRETPDSQSPLTESRATPDSQSPEPSGTLEGTPPLIPPEVAALNGHTTEVIERFRLVARNRPPTKPLKVDVPALMRGLNDRSHLPELARHAKNCAEWLGSPKGLARKDAAGTLRNWLDRELAKLPKEAPDGERPKRFTNFQNA